MLRSTSSFPQINMVNSDEVSRTHPRFRAPQGTRGLITLKLVSERLRGVPSNAGAMRSCISGQPAPPPRALPESAEAGGTRPAWTWAPDLPPNVLLLVLLPSSVPSARPQAPPVSGVLLASLFRVTTAQGSPKFSPPPERRGV